MSQFKRSWRIFQAVALASCMFLLAGCETVDPAVSARRAFSYDDLYLINSQKVAVVVETTSILPRRSDKDSVGPLFFRVDLNANKNFTKGASAEYLTTSDIFDGPVSKGSFPVASAPLPYQIVSASGPFDYSLVSYARNDGRILENLCFYKAALVFRFQPGVLNYIPKELQPPLYTGEPLSQVEIDKSVSKLRSSLSLFPVVALNVVIPEIVAVVEYEPTIFGQAFNFNRCSEYKENFKRLTINPYIPKDN